MIKIGITGIIGSGKTTVSKILNVIDIPVYDADINAKRLMVQSNTIIDGLTSEFGKNIYIDNQINKVLLSELVFNNEDTRKIINSIVHPVVISDFSDWSIRQKAEIIAVESALLFESGLYKSLNYSIVVNSDTEVLVNRIIKRDSLSYSVALSRVKLQENNFNVPATKVFYISNNFSDSIVLQLLQIIKELELYG